METSLQIELPESMRYDPYNTNLKPITLGNIGKASWSLLPKWVNSKLPILEVSRTDNQGHFKIDAKFFVIPQGYSQNKRDLTKYIEDGQTTIRLETKWSASFAQYEEIKGHISIKMCAIVDKPQLSNDIVTLLNNPDSYPDATIVCGTTKILVHRCILTARSPVFAAMFKNQMKEGLSGVVEIKDLEENVLQSTLKFIYSDKTDDIHNELACDLLFAADMYQLKELKAICIDKLKSSIEEENVFRILVLGYLHDRGLKNTAIEFICKMCRKNYWIEIIAKKYLKLLNTQYPDLAEEVRNCVLKYGCFQNRTSNDFFRYLLR